MMFKNLKVVLFSLLIVSVTVVSAQEACSALVEEALLAVEESCVDLGRNQACYGNVDLTAEAQPDAADFSFQALGDVVDVSDIASLELSELNEDAGTWGVAVMSLQADIPNTLPGQNVTFILFGDVLIENASTDEQTPMQAFYLRTGVGEVACDEAPESGVLIQTPDGVDEVTFNINGVDVQVGSTVLFQTEDSETSDDSLDLVVSTVEGSAALIFDDETYPAVEGTQIRMPINQDLLPTGRPNLPQAYHSNRVAALPIAPLPRQIGLAPPLSEDNIAQLQQRIQNGEPPCGVDGLPSCERLLPILQNGSNLPPRERWGMRFEDGVNCVQRTDASISDQERTLPFCPPTNRDNRPTPTFAIANNELEFSGDQDNDGILNVDDACPLRAGTSEFMGCPSAPNDTDGDGFVDALDYCPNQVGDVRGCPIAPSDSDNDGFPDSVDVCPNRAGIADYRGCPSDPREADSDNDGVPNGDDDCPRRAGVPENNGCPIILPTTVPQVSVPTDTDGDGIPDNEDECPNQVGDFMNVGCPTQNTVDTDGDGIADDADRCPNQTGTAQYFGCQPPADSDGDGITDNQDRCPNLFGTAERNGCPLPPDSDGDGIADNQDRCPNQFGIIARNGCPALGNGS
ncbi:MAG: thrombospondin type 3 repeat-containing protein [Phototrophicaceae bacterium]